MSSRPPAELRRLIRTWDELGKSDPLWAVLSNPDKRGGRWDLEQFMETGREEVAAVVAHARSHRPELGMRRALDFGCGVGRLSVALAEHFEEVDGVDISPSMIARAQATNGAPGRCRYHLNQVGDLRLFDDGRFDLVYSNITLQHMPPALAGDYIAELCRVLAPEGLLIFQMPSELRIRWVRRVLLPARLFWQRRVRGLPGMDMFVLPSERVRALVEAAGCRVLCAERDDSAGPDWTSYRYCVAPTS
ncbi:MAG: class I SAM-dependent methyltransferase [Planctomycetota bacterium]|jgi:SAM-dependent methyltransferase